MANICIELNDGTVLNFKHEGRAGGSYTKTIRYDGAFAIVEDEWGKRTAIPAANIRMIEETPERGRW